MKPKQSRRSTLRQPMSGDTESKIDDYIMVVDSHALSRMKNRKTHINVIWHACCTLNKCCVIRENITTTTEPQCIYYRCYLRLLDYFNFRISSHYRNAITTNTIRFINMVDISNSGWFHQYNIGLNGLIF